MAEGISPREFGALEAKVSHLTERLEEFDGKICRLDARIEKLTSLLDQARGARWMLAMIVAIPAFAAGVLAALKGMRPVVVALLLTSSAMAHDTGFTAEENAWLDRQRAVDGTKCCNEHDVTIGERVQWRMTAGRYEVLIGETWRPVPPGRLMQSIPDDPTPWPGRALLFRTGTMIWCFFPEPLT